MGNASSSPAETIHVEGAPEVIAGPPARDTAGCLTSNVKFFFYSSTQLDSVPFDAEGRAKSNGAALNCAWPDLSAERGIGPDCRTPAKTATKPRTSETRPISFFPYVPLTNIPPMRPGLFLSPVNYFVIHAPCKYYYDSFWRRCPLRRWLPFR